jgi:hypothetical protein
MTQKTWIYLTILVVVLVGAGIFFWWFYVRGAISPEAATPEAGVTQTFTDVPIGDANNSYEGQYWAFNQIEAVNKKGWMVGWTVVPFKPEQGATRADIAVALARAYNKSYDNPTPTFTDVAKDNAAYKEIEGLKQAGWIDGFPDGTFRPTAVADRGTLAGFVASAHNNGKVPGDNNMPPKFTDCLNATSCPFYNEIQYLASLSPAVITGYSDGTFRPTAVADRQALAVVLAKDKQLDISNPPATPSFSDVPTTQANYAYIEAVKTAGYVTGYPPVKEFRPDQEADRATVAVAIGRATNNILGGGTPTFTDVPADYWAFGEIEGVNKAGIMTGFTPTVFCPDTDACEAARAIATRSTAAVVIARAKKLTLEPNGAQVFADLAPGAFGYAEANALYKAGYTKGCSTDASGKPNYCPDQELTRAALAVFIYNAFVLTTPTIEATPPASATPTPRSSSTGTGTGSGSTTSGSGTASTGAEIPLAGAGILSGLFALRYVIGKRLK